MSITTLKATPKGVRPPVCLVGLVGFYKPDPGWNKSPNFVLSESETTLRVFETPSEMVFEIAKADWMSIDEMEASVLMLLDSARIVDEADN